MKKHWPILVVDDEEVMCESMAAWLREDGYHVDTASNGQKAVEQARATDYAICFVDLKMPGGMDGIETMMEIHRVRPEASIIIITAYATVDTAIQAMKEGAQEYIVKPCNPQEISMLVSRILKLKKLQSENAILRKKLTRQYKHHDIITKNPRMQEILELTQDIASLRSTVLIRGESGTGKELVARAVHFSGNRAEKPFIAVSCAALTETLLESELFGYEKGAFTGGQPARPKGSLNWRMPGPSFWTRLVTFRQSYRLIYSAFCRSVVFTASAAPRKSRWMYASLQPPIRTLPRKCSREDSARICTTGST